MTKDATGKEIVIGSQYGYSKSSNGFTYVTIGEASKVNNGKITLKNTTEKRYLWVSQGEVSPTKITNSTKSRTLAAVQVFPINS